MTIQVIGRQWFWEVRYPGTAAVTANEIHIPARTPVTIEATTGDVIHSFWVPQLNRKIDMIPGRTNRVELYADKPGLYRGQCAEFCGARARAHGDVRLRRRARPLHRLAARAGRARHAAAGPAFARDGCASCHTIRGTDAKGDVGPDLTHLGSRSTLAALTHPQRPNARSPTGCATRSTSSPATACPTSTSPTPTCATLVDYLEGLK